MAVFFLLHLHCWFGICWEERGVTREGGELRLGVNIAKCRNATTKVFRV